MLLKQVTEGEYTDLIFKGRTLFSIHSFENNHFIREEVGIASTILPEGFEGNAFQELETAISYCASETQNFFNNDSTT